MYGAIVVNNEQLLQDTRHDGEEKLEAGSLLINDDPYLASHAEDQLQTYLPTLSPRVGTILKMPM